MDLLIIFMKYINGITYYFINQIVMFFFTFNINKKKHFMKHTNTFLKREIKNNIKLLFLTNSLVAISEEKTKP